MVRLLLFTLSICSTVLCGFVAYLSLKANQETAKLDVAPTPISAQSLIDQPPTNYLHLNLTHFQAGKHLATRDLDSDKKWEQVCLPLFPDQWTSLKNSYPAVIVCFDRVKDLAMLDRQVEVETLETYFNPRRQQLDNDLHSQLAKKYKSMDFRRCVVLHTQSEASTQILGTGSLRISLGLAGLSILFGVWQILALLLGWLFGFGKNKDQEEAAPIVNRAGLPMAEDKQVSEKDFNPDTSA